MLFDYVTKSGQLAKVEAADANDALKKATNIDPHSGVSLAVNQQNSSQAPLNPLPPTTPPQNTERDLPAPTDTTSRLLQFSSALDTATKIAQKKRLDYQANILKQGVAPGVRSASDFSGLISNLDNNDQSFVKPLVNTALDVAKSAGDDITAIAKSATINRAPKDVVDKILSSQSLGDALALAAPYIQTKADDGSTTTFTKSQLNSGAANAGVSPEMFSSYDDNTKNIFINGDLNSSKKLIDKEITDGSSLEDITKGISDLGLPQHVSDYLIKYGTTQSASNGPSTPEETKNKITKVLKDLQTSGYDRDEAENAVRAELADSNGDLTGVLDDALSNALVDVYGRTFWQKVLPGGK